MDDKIIVQLDQNALIQETEKSIQSNLQNLEEEEKKPLEERVISKEWRVRKNAFLEVFQNLSINYQIDTKFYSKYDFVYQKLFDETNPNCQEHGVDIIKLIIEKYSIEDSMKIDFFKQIVEKLCLSQKSQCKNKAKDLVLYLYENSSDRNSLINSLKVLLENKKRLVVVISTLDVIFMMLNEFGSSQIDFNNLMPYILKTYEFSNPAIRNWILEIVKNLYKWIKEDIRPLLTGIKEKELKEINSILSKLANTEGFNDLKLVPKRILKAVIVRKKEEKDNILTQQKLSDKVLIEKKVEETKVEVKVNNYMNIAMINIDKILSETDVNLNDLLSEEVFKAENNPEDNRKILDHITKKIKGKNVIFDNIVYVNSKLKEFLKENELAYSTILLISELSVLLQHTFIGVKDFFPLICEKLKENNLKIRKDVLKCLDNIISNNNYLGDYIDFVENLIEDDSVYLKLGLCEFLYNGIQKTYINTLKLFSFEIVELSCKLTEDMNEEVQEWAIKCVAILKVRLGNNFSEKIYKEISEENKIKIEEQMHVLSYDKMFDDKEYFEPDINLSEKKRKKEVEIMISQRKKLEKEKPIINKVAKKETENISNNYKTNKKAEIIDLKLESDNSLKKNYETEITNMNNVILFEDKKENEIVEEKKSTVIKEEKIDNIDIDKLPFDERPIQSNKKNMMNFDEFPPENDEFIKQQNEKKAKMQNNKKKVLSVQKASNNNNNVSLLSDTKDINDKNEEQKLVVNDNNNVTSTKKENVVKKNEKPKADTKNDKKADNKKGDGPKEQDEEDTKLSKDEIEEKINSAMENLDLKTLFASAKWEDRKKAFSDMNEFLKENGEKLEDLTEHLILFIKNKLKDWKEGNFNINKEAVLLLNQIIINKKGIDKKQSKSIIKGFHERITDNKIKDHVINLYLLLMEYVTPAFVLDILLKILKNSKSPSLLKDYSNFFEKVISEFGINTIPVKELVEFCKNLANHTNPQVRSSATTLLCELYKYIGKDLLTLLKDIKESTLKIIEDAFNEVKVITNKNEMEKPKRTVKSSTQITNNAVNMVKSKGANNESGNLLNIELIPRVDISKKITAKILKDINNGKWNEKKEAMESLEKVLTEANNRILPNGLNDLFVAIKSKLADGNKNFVRLLVSFLTRLIDAIGNPYKNNAKNIAAPLISLLGDKQQNVREDVVFCIDHWINKVGFENVVIYLPSFLKQDNFEMRTELLKIILKNKDSFMKCDLKEFTNPLLLCLQDKTTSIRNLSEEVIVSTLRSVSINVYFNALKDFKPAIVNTIKPILDKYKGGVIEDNLTGRGNERKIASSSDKINVYEENRQMNNSPSNRKIGTKASKDKVAVTNKKPPKGTSQAQTRENNNRTPVLEEHNNYGTNSMYRSNSPKNSNMFGSIFINISNSKQLKEKRLEMEKKIKFNFDQITEDMNIKLKDQIKNYILIDVVDKMFSDDLKMNIEVLSILQNSLKSEVSLFFDCFDLILKWVIIKSSSQQNPIFIKALIEFFDTVLNYISEKDYKLNDNECTIIIATLIDKFSVAKLKENLKNIIEKYESVISPYRMFSLLVSCSINKNPKIKGECLDICTCLIIKHGVGTASFKDIKSIAKILESNDNSLKSSALYLLIEVYKQLKDNFWSIVSDISDKTKDLLESKMSLINLEENSTVSKKGMNRSNITQTKAKLDKSKDKSFENDVELKHNTSYDGKKIKSSNSQNSLKSSPKKAKESEINNIDEATKLKGNFDLMNYLSVLENGEVKERVNILIILNDMISSTKNDSSKIILSMNLDLIIKTFINCLQSAFDKSINEIPIKFGKYLLTVLYKICCLKELILKISYKVLFELCEEVLSKLLIDNLDKIGENQEGKIILKSLNGTMLRVLENCSPTDIFSVLIELVRKYRTSSTTPRIAGLAIKCLLKLTQIINQIINDINIEIILVKIHEFIADMEQTNPDLNPKHQNDELSLRIIKTIISELVKIKKEEFNEIYNKTVEKHHIKEVQIKKWISIILKSVTSSTEQTSSTPYSNRSPLPKECIALLEELTKQVYDNEELNNNKIQTLFSMFARVNFDFTRLNNVIENKLYQKLLVFWENSGVSEKGKNNDASPIKKYNNIDNLIEYKNKLQEITKQYKQQQNITNDKEKIKSNEGTSSPKKGANNKKDLQNSEVYNKISNLKSKLTNYNDNRNSNLNRTFQEDEPRNAFNKINDLKKKLKDNSSNNNNFLSTSTLPNMDEGPSLETNQNLNLSSYQNDTLSKLSEIKNKLNTFKKNSFNNNANNK